MSTVPSISSRARALPVILALVFNLMLPVASATVPSAGLPEPEAATAAAEPNQITFTLQGCRLEAGSFLEPTITCTDAGYTTGNLGKGWNELDLVPHRVTLENKNGAQTYSFIVAGDYINNAGTAVGWDFISPLTLNASHSDAGCGAATVGALSITPSGSGAGGADQTIYRLVTVTQSADQTCVYDYYQRLALGASKFSGSSLQSNLWNQNLGAQGIGQKRVSIPVKEILPQQLRKTMSATTGQEYTWNLSKWADPTSIHFADTCDTTEGALSASVAITVSWTRSGPNAAGDTVIETKIWAKNPAHRTITVDVNDKIYEGANQSVLIDEISSGPVNIPAETELLVLTHQFAYSGSATTFNDVATATYTDLLTGLAVPGQTTATASATAVPGGDPINATALITDTESITGTGLSFSVAQPALGAFSNYTAGQPTTGPVNWSYLASASGSVTFDKTVTLDQPRITSGSLADTAKAIGAGDTELASATLAVPITSAAKVKLTINKSIPEGSLRTGESVTFNFRITGPGGYDENRSISFSHGDDLSVAKSLTISDLAPGTYSVEELSTAGWETGSTNPQTVDLNLPNCSGSATFGNAMLPADLAIDKTTSTPEVNAGDAVSYTIKLTNTGSGAAQDVEITDNLPSGIAWSESSDDCEIVSGTLSCGPLDIPAGGHFSVTLHGVTSAGECPSISNWASYSSRNAGSGSTESDPTVITVNCPDVSVSKTGSSVVSAGDAVQFDITVANSGPGDAYNVVLTDTLPAVSGGWALGAENDEGDCDLIGLDLSCDFGTLESGDSRTVKLIATTSAADCGDLANNASVSASNEPADALANNQDSHTIRVDCPALQITKVADDSIVSAGEDIGFTITVTNLGPGKAYDVSLTDALPGGLAWTDDSADCEIAGGTLSCDYGTLDAGASASVHVSAPATSDDCATLQNTAFADASNNPNGPVDATAQVTIECPGLNIAKTADSGIVNAGDVAAFEVLIWNAGPGQAFDVTFSDTVPGTGWSLELLNPDDDDACIGAVVAGEDQEEWSCTFGTLDPSPMADGKVIRLTKTTAFEDCGLIDNTAFADASNGDPVDDSATIRVDCPAVAIAKSNDSAESVLPGSVVSFSLEVGVANATSPGDPVNAYDVVVVDLMPDGYDAPTAISGGGAFDAASRTITWDLGDLSSDDSPLTLTYQAAISADAQHGDELVNVALVTSSNSQCPDEAGLAEECVDDSTVTVRVPTLVIDKSADVEQVSFTLDEAGNVTSINPAVVTWTLSWTLTDGPVTNAVIADPIPAFLTYVEGSATDGGAFDAATSTLTWTFASLTESGSVTFQATVDEQASGEIENVATIVSDQTAEDEGVASITVSEQVVLGPTPTPIPKIPDTATTIRVDGQPVVVLPIALLVLLFSGSLGALALANVRAVRRRR
jgi:uncharacterized repeat protein (TIGR01451 family)